MLHANDSSPTKVHGSQMMRMRREVLPRAPQVSVVTQTITASGVSTSTSTSLPQTSTPVPIGPMVGGIVGGMLIVLLAVGGWWWWGSLLNDPKANGAKARRAQSLTAARTRHSKTESTETLKTTRGHSQTTLSEKTQEKQSKNSAATHETVQLPSAILAQQQKNTRPPFMHQANSSTSLTSSKYTPSRPSPLALNVVTRALSVVSDNPPTVLVTAPPQSEVKVMSPQSAALHSLSPLPPQVHIVPPSPPPPAHVLPVPGTEKNQRQSVQSMQSVQSVASEYSLDSPIGVAYGGDELEREPYINPRDEWRASREDVMDPMHAATQGRSPFGNA